MKTFEEKMQRLEEIVNLLDSDKTSLDDSIKLYEEGLGLTKELEKQLKSFEEKIENIGKENEWKLWKISYR